MMDIIPNTMPNDEALLTKLINELNKKAYTINKEISEDNNDIKSILSDRSFGADLVKTHKKLLSLYRIKQREFISCYKYLGISIVELGNEVIRVNYLISTDKSYSSKSFIMDIKKPDDKQLYHRIMSSNLPFSLDVQIKLLLRRDINAFIRRIHEMLSAYSQRRDQCQQCLKKDNIAKITADDEYLKVTVNILLPGVKGKKVTCIVKLDYRDLLCVLPISVAIDLDLSRISVKKDCLLGALENFLLTKKLSPAVDSILNLF